MTRKNAIVLAILAMAAVLALPVQDELASRVDLSSTPTPLLAVSVASVTVLVLVLGTKITFGTYATESSSVRRLAKRSNHLAESLLRGSVAQAGALYEKFGPIDVARDRPVLPDDSFAGRIVVLVGPAGCGKSVAIARLAKLIVARGGPVFYGHAAELWPASERGERPTVEQALIARFVDLGISPELATEWFEYGALSLLVDGVNETSHRPSALLTELETFHRRYPDCTVICAVRRVEAPTAWATTFEEWRMPQLPKVVVQRRLRGLPVVERADEEGRTVLADVGANPLFLSMLGEVAPGQLGPGDITDAERARRSIVESAVRNRLGWRAGEAPGPDAVFSCWLATAMRLVALGSTLELRSVAWTMLPERVRRRVRVLSLVTTGVPILVVCSAVVVWLGLGIAGVTATLAYTVALITVGNLSIGDRPVIRPQRWEVVAVRRWSLAQLRGTGAAGARTVARRTLLGLGYGTLTGVLEWVAFELTPPSVDGTGWAIWGALALVPLLVGVFGAFVGGLASGVVGSAAVGMNAGFGPSVIGGLAAGFAAGLYFSLVDLGDVRMPVDVTEGGDKVSRTLWSSARQQTVFNVVTWLGFGLAGGLINHAAHPGDPQWFWQGIGTGVAGAALFGGLALVSPVGSYVIADLGLRWSGLLPDRSLNSMLARLITKRVLVSAGTGTSFRFSHPLVAEFLEGQSSGRPA